jgi:SAM-dependent methyltransferase
VLDVGCGFGGFLIAAARRGAKTHGIELSDLRRDAAEALLTDNGIDPDVRAMDVYSAEFDSLANMDVIVSENVIEHVADPRRFMSRLLDKLAPGGILYLEIPNKDSVQIVAKDSHYHMPLLTQLPHHSARALFEQVKGKDAYGMPYGVEEYYPLSWYINLLIQRDMQVQVSARGDALVRPSEINDYLAIINNVANNVKETYPTIDAHLTDQIERAAREYLRNIDAARVDPNMAEVLVMRFLSAAWCLTARHGR